MIVVGLTGSIGMGKTTTAAMFAEAGAAVFDADAAVHALYAPGGAAVDAVVRAFPGVRKPEGGVDRALLSAKVRGDAAAFARLEGIVHPFVAARRTAFVRDAERRGAAVAVLDIPLLFEVGAADAVDAVVVVSAPSDVQRARVLARPGMTEALFEAIRARQVPDAEKRARADYVIDTGRGFASARLQVDAVLRSLRRRAEQGRLGSPAARRAKRRMTR